MTRPIRVTIDTILSIMKDYMGPEDVPWDAVAVKLRVHPQSKKLGLVVESPDIPFGASDLEMRFEIRRFHGVGN